MAEPSRRYGIQANQIDKWKKQFLDDVASVFASESEAAGTSEREDELLKTIGQLTVELEFYRTGSLGSGEAASSPESRSIPPCH